MKLLRAARGDEIVDKDAAEASAGAPTTLRNKKKRKRPDAAAGASSRTGVGVGTILARMHARGAITRSLGRLIRSPEFTCAPPPPRPPVDVAYLAAAQIKRRPEHEHPTSGYYGFHIAGAGDAPAPTPPTLAGNSFLATEYINTCNGVLLLATKGFSDPCRCTLWNPAVTDDLTGSSEVTVPKPPSPEKRITSLPDDEDDDSSIETVLWHEKTQFLALGFGCGRRSDDTYKLLLCRKDTSQITRSRPGAHGKPGNCLSGGTTRHFEYSLVVHTLGSRGGGDDIMPLRTVAPMETVLSMKNEVVPEIMESKSLYMDGTIYFLYWKKNAMLAFDVDDETVRTIDMPSKRQLLKDDVLLIEMSGRPCLVTIIDTRNSVELWLLSGDYRLEQIHVISYKSDLDYLCRRSIVGVWDCGGVLVLCLECSEKGKLFLYDVAAKKTFGANLPGDFITVKKSEYMLCWGYKRTLVSPESIVRELGQDMERRRSRSAHITQLINALVLQDKRKGQKATLNTVCLMEFLVHIMQKLPYDLQDVVEMLSMDSVKR